MLKKKVLISGYKGFTGKYLFNSLLRSNYYFPIKLDVDIRNFNAVNKHIKKIQPDVFINLAAISIIKNYSYDFYCETNAFPIKNIINSLRSLENNPKLIVISSGNFYSTETKSNENSKRVLFNNYSKSKDLLEQLTMDSNYENFLILRPFNYTGVNQSTKFLLPKLVDHMIKKKNVIQLGNLDAIREFNNIQIIVNIYQALFEYNGSEKIINIGSGIGYKISDVLSSCFNFFKHYPKVEIYSEFKRENEQKILVCDNTKLMKILSSIDPKFKWPKKKENLENILNEFRNQYGHI